MGAFNRKKILFLLITVVFFTKTFAQQTYRDNFSSVSYSNNDGSANFSSNWSESGESTSPSSGKIRINSNQLRFRNMDYVSISRALNLSGATSATLTLDYNRTSGNERINVQLFDGSTYNTIATLSGTGSVNYTLDPSEISSSSSIQFVTDSGSWSSSETIFVDNVLFTATFNPTISINDVSVNENAGTATFTATHIGLSTAGAFTVNYQTVDGTATGGSDYTTIGSGTLSFNGTVGDTETVTVSITDDTLFESDETYTIQFTSVSDGSVNISNTATGTIVDDEVVLGNTPLTLFEELDGYIDYASTGGSLRTQSNTSDPCAIGTSSSNTLSSPIPVGATIEKAILYWAHSGAVMDNQIIFEGTTIDAEIVYSSTVSSLTFHGSYADVTSLVSSIANPSTNVYDFSGLTIDTSSTYCNTNTVLGGWSLMIFYSAAGLPASTINLYQGFDGNSNSSSSFSLSGFYAIGSTGSKTTALSWEGDQTLANNESLQFTTPLAGTNLLVGDGDNNGTTVNNPFNSTNYDNTILPNVNNTTIYGVDLDTYDVSAYILAGETSATTQVNVGQDLVIMNAVVLKVPSNLITGQVFEDVNYGGGAGRNLATASGVGLLGATVELYDSGGTLVETTTTEADGTYVFAGMDNGSYSVKVVNGSVRSSRTGGSACTTCIPVQTFRKDYLLSTLTETTTEVGGADPSGVDIAAGTLTGAQTISSVTISSEGVAGLDFGFNFNTVVNTNDSAQGSLRQFIINSNNLTGNNLLAQQGLTAAKETSVFMIPSNADPLGRTTDPNFSGGVATITLNSTLTTITDNDTYIDGATQTTHIGNTNSGFVGTGGTVGVDAEPLPTYQLPEIAINGGDRTAIAINGDISNTLISNMSIYNADIGVLASGNGGTGTNRVVSSMLLGVLPDGGDPGLTLRNNLYGAQVQSPAQLTVTSSYIGWNRNGGILGVSSTSVLQATYNEVFQNSWGSNSHDGIDMDGINGTIQYNLVYEQQTSSGLPSSGGGSGIELGSKSVGIGNNLVDNNTVFNNISAGINLRKGPSNNTISKNIIYGNEVGVSVNDENRTTDSNTITQNSIYNNNGLGIDLHGGGGSNFDGVTLNDLGDSDSGSNGLTNFPIISSIYATGTNLIVKGWARPGAIIELFLTDVNQGTATEGDNQLGMSIDYGEGQTYIATFVEGSGSDLDAGSSLYTDVDGNTDNTNQFQFSIALPPGVLKGNYVTSTATIANATSEFSPFSIVKTYSLITNRRITYRVNKD